MIVPKNLFRIGAIILTGTVVVLAVLSLPEQQMRTSPVAMVDVPPPLVVQPKPVAAPPKNVAAITAPAHTEPLVRFEPAAGGDHKPVVANDGRSGAGPRTEEGLRERENAAVQQEPKGPGDLAAAAITEAVGPAPPARTGPGATGSVAKPGPGDAEAPKTASTGEAKNPATAGQPTPAGTIMVVRQANLRAKPHRNGQLIAMFQPGRELTLLEAAPVRGYYRVTSGEAEGWIWREVLGPPQLAASDAAAPAAQSPSSAPRGNPVGN